MTSADCFELQDLIQAGKLAMHYQPRVGAGAHRAVGAEALLRWSPNGGEWESMPGLADLSSDEYALLWTWQLDQVRECFRALRRRGWTPSREDPGFFISLNISHRQLGSNIWAEQLMALLDDERVPGNCLEVELTEQGRVPDHGLTSSAFEQLRAVGVAIALDDFPEGGDSFLRLAQFQFDKVKFDRCMVPSFDDPVPVWMKKRSIIKDLVSIVERSGACAVIEGVEREVQHRFLSTLNVREWQGYLWGKAMPLRQLASGLDFGSVERAVPSN